MFWFCLEYMSHLMTKPTKSSVRPVKTKISLGIRPIWSESSLSTWRKLGSLATHCVHSEDAEQTGQMPRLIWVFARCSHFCHTCFSMGDLGMQVSVCLFIHPSVRPSTFTMGVLWAQLLLQFFSVFLKLCRCFLHGVRMCMWFGYSC